MDIDIIGCCISRDTFGITETEKYHVKNYFQWNSIISLTDDPIGEDFLTTEEDYPSLSSQFVRRCAKNNVNKSVFSKLESNKSEWIILDFFAESYDTVEVQLPNGRSIHYSTNEEIHSAIQKLLKTDDRFSGSQSRVLSDIPDYSDRVRQLFAILKGMYGDNIIVIGARQAMEYLKGGSIYPFSNRINYMSQNQKIMTGESLFLSVADCYYIPIPQSILSNVDHKWGPGGAHYIDEGYDYLLSSVDMIISGFYSIGAMVSLYNEYDALFNSIRLRVLEGFSDSIRKADAMCKKDSFDEGAKRIFIDNSRKGNNTSLSKLSAYVESGMMSVSEISELLLAVSANADEIWAKDLMIRHLIERNTESSLDLALEYSKSKPGDTDLRMLKHRLFLEERLASSSDDKAHLVELCRTISKRDPEYKTKLSELECNYNIDDLAESKNYRSGLCGRKKDYRIALKYASSALDKGIPGAEIEYFDLVCIAKRIEDYGRALESLLKVSEENNKYVLGRLGRAYSKGIGTDVNLTVAADYYRMASDKGLLWAKVELLDVLWKMNTEDSLIEMISLAENLSNDDNTDGMKVLQKAYRCGKGVSLNLDISMWWCNRAKELGASWADEEIEIINQLGLK